MLAAASYSGQAANSSDNVLRRQVRGANLQNVPVGQAALNALINAEAAGGVATIQDCNGPITHIITPGDASLRGVLDSIVSADPRYAWEVKDDVINFFPRGGAPSFFAVRVAKFEIRDARTPNEALAQLLGTPEVQTALRDLGRHSVQGGVYPFCPQGCPQKETKKISVSLKGVTVRQALNTIALTHGSAVWKFSQGQCNGGKLFSIEFAFR